MTSEHSTRRPSQDSMRGACQTLRGCFLRSYAMCSANCSWSSILQGSRHSLSWTSTAGVAYSTRTSSSRALSSQSRRSSRTGCPRGSSAPSTAGTGASRQRYASTCARSASQAARGSPTQGACSGTRPWCSAHASRLVWATSSTQTRHSASCWPSNATRKHKANWSRHGQPPGRGGDPRACGA